MPEVSTVKGVLQELPDAERKGYTFAGWYTAEIGGTEITLDRLYKKNTTIYAHWKVNQYRVSFDTNGGNDIESVTVEFNTKVDKPEDPIYGDYLFDGWYVDDTLTEAYDFQTPVTADLQFYAKWKEKPVTTEDKKTTEKQGDSQNQTTEKATGSDNATTEKQTGSEATTEKAANVISASTEKQTVTPATTEKATVTPGTTEKQSTTPDTTEVNVQDKKPGKISGLKVKARKEKITVTWKKMSGKNLKYQVQYSKKANFKSAKSKKVTAAKVTIKGLKKGKWYVRVRAYNSAGKGAWAKKSTKV